MPRSTTGWCGGYWKASCPICIGRSKRYSQTMYPADSDFDANATLRFDPKNEQFTVLKSNSRNARARSSAGPARCGFRSWGRVSWW